MKQVFYHGQETDLDAASYEHLRDEIARDQRGLALAGQRVPISADAFHAEGDYLWDANLVQFAHQDLDADAATFTTIDRLFARDRDGLFFLGKRLDVPSHARPRSAVVIELSEQQHVFRGQGRRFGNNISPVVHGEALLIEDAFLLTEDAVYWWGQLLDADPASFCLVGELSVEPLENKFWRYQPSYAYAKDKSHVWRLQDSEPPKRLTMHAASFACQGAWAWDHETVAYAGKRLENANPNDFEVLSENWSRSSERVWYQCYELSGANPTSFSVLAGQFAKDAHRVWMATLWLDELCAETAELCCEYGGSPRTSDEIESAHCEAVFKDAKGVWQVITRDSDYSDCTSSTLLVDADAGSYKMLDAMTGLASDKKGIWLCDQRIANTSEELHLFPGGYWRLGDSWWHHTDLLRQVRGDQPCPKAAYAVFSCEVPAPMQAYGDGFFGNDFKIWHRGDRLEIDPKGARALGSGYLQTEQGISHWQLTMTSRKVVSFESLGGMLDGVDTESFQVLGDNYSADKESVFWQLYPTQLDPDSVQLLGGGWARDRDSVCCHGRNTLADPSRLRVLGGSQLNRYAGTEHGACASDDSTVYRGAQKLEEEYALREFQIDANSFEVLSEWFARDAQHVFELHVPSHLERLDCRSFGVLARCWARDIDSLVYVGDDHHWPVMVDSVDLDSFEPIDDIYGADSKTVFARGKATRIDRASFRHIADGWAVDMSGVWFGDKLAEFADAASFGVCDLAPNLMQDDHGVFESGYGHINRIVEVARYDTRPIGEGYWCDKKMLFYASNSLAPVADDLRVFAENSVINDAIVYYENIAMK